MDIQLEVDSPSKPIDALFVENSGAAKPLELWAAKRVRMTLNQFSSFAAVAKHMSLTKASMELRVSQSSISQQLKQLENHHGAQLYRRVSKGVEITEAGQLFLRKVMPILEQVGKLEAGFKASGLKPAREFLEVGGTFSPSAILLPALLTGLQQRHPQAELAFRTRTSENLERLVAGATMDLAVTARVAPSADVVCEPLRRERVVMFVPENHPLSRKKRLKLSDMLSEPIVIRGGKGISGTTEKALKQLARHGLNVNIVLRCEDPTAVQAAVRQRMGVGIGFEDTVKSAVTSGEFKILDVPGLELAGESFIIYSRKRPLSPLAQEFLELLRSARQKDSLHARAKSSNHSIAAI